MSVCPNRMQVGGVDASSCGQSGHVGISEGGRGLGVVLIRDPFLVKQAGDQRLQAGCTKVDFAPRIYAPLRPKKRSWVTNGTDPGPAVDGIPFGDGHSRR